MEQNVTILIAEDDEGHATLIKRNLRRVGITNPSLHFKDGQEVLDYLFRRGSGPHRQPEIPLVLLLDIRMPKVDGVEVLRQLKHTRELCHIPVTMLSTTDDRREVDRCYKLGCNNYIVKPVDYQKFIQAIRQLGLFLTVVQIPNFGEEYEDREKNYTDHEERFQNTTLF